MGQRYKLPIDNLPNKVNLAIAWSKDPLTELDLVINSPVPCRILGLRLTIAIYKDRAHDW